MASQDIADKHADLVERAVRALNLALRLAAEADLHLTLNVYRQDLQEGLNVVEGTAPAVEVMVSRR
jgi:tRNA1(Val) A37 N6-methylase TrmN6